MGDTATFELTESLPISDLEKSLKPLRSTDVEAFRRDVQKAQEDPNITFDKFSDYMQLIYDFPHFQREYGSVFDEYQATVAFLCERDYY